ncbi:hypothetical protein [Psychromonas arctica]|uniref:hypothetical protein n=1 Tax=Psychromonas arctica TaxID=168275 RepID=UPI002FD36AF4
MFNDYIKINKADTSGFLTNFINAYNADLIVAEQNEDKIELLEAKLAQSYTEFDEQKTINADLTSTLAETKSKLVDYEQNALEAQKKAHQHHATQRELLLSKQQISSLQKELSTLKSGENPKRLREQIKRIKEKSTSDKKRLSVQEGALKEARRAIAQATNLLHTKDEMIRLLNKQLAHNTGSGLYHNGEHHLIIWPEKTIVERPDGEQFEARSLLYMHQSGRAALIHFDPYDGEAYLSKSPRAGLRPSPETKEFAKNWLYTVNSLQGGVVKDKDMMAVNYNDDVKTKDSCLILEG